MEPQSIMPPDDLALFIYFFLICNVVIIKGIESITVLLYWPPLNQFQKDISMAILLVMDTISMTIWTGFLPSDFFHWSGKMLAFHLKLISIDNSGRGFFILLFFVMSNKEQLEHSFHSHADSIVYMPCGEKINKNGTKIKSSNHYPNEWQYIHTYVSRHQVRKSHVLTQPDTRIPFQFDTKPATVKLFTLKWKSDLIFQNKFSDHKQR